MKYKINLFFILLFILSINPIIVFAQIESSSLIFNRGKLWQTVQFGKVGPQFSNWTQRGIGLDWPGFDASLISDNIGGQASHLVSGGLIVGAKWTQDSILSVEEWSMYAGSVAEGAGAKYRVKTHRRVYPNGANHWLQSNPNAGEEVIETIWEYNTDYTDEFQIKRMLPIRVRRTSHQWSGSKADENYIIHEYIIKNISPEIKNIVPPTRFVADTLFDFYAVINYGIHSNSRSWSVLFPSLSPGARNTQFFYNSARRLLYGRAADYPETPGLNEDFGYSPAFGPTINGRPTGEYLAPAFAGIKLLYSSPDKNGIQSNVVRYGWSAASNSIDLSGPLTNIGSLEAQYDFVKDIRLAANFVSSSTDTVFMTRSRMWSLMQLGPYNILPGDSIRIVIAEIVDGVDYKQAIDPLNNPVNIINRDTRNAFFASADRAQQTYDNGFNHNDPPAAPEFIVDYNRESQSVANIIKWNNDKEAIPDPDNGNFDLVGYIIYRSDFLPIGPWIAIDTVTKGDINYLEGNTYTYVDSLVTIGQRYYYALTSFDTQGLETSIFANRLQIPFTATLPPKDNLEDILVVPNPFVIGEGFSQPGEQDKIQFVNLPNPCTIRIFTVRGDLVKTIDVKEGDGAIVSWDQVTDFGQFVESGVYIFHAEFNGGTKIGKFAIVR
ncbi:MAG: hypothetical protein HRF52_12230 [Ignavibacterium sp.]|jgi:hypothetical protein|uniref:hypothetical protein n=1 Tax=Ignavibacterium sp. TaxID=2651167 RepID=UPI00329827C6